MKMVGHKTESIYKRYSIVDHAMLEIGANKLNAAQQAALTPARRPASGGRGDKRESPREWIRLRASQGADGKAGAAALPTAVRLHPASQALLRHSNCLAGQSRINGRSRALRRIDRALPRVRRQPAPPSAGDRRHVGRVPSADRITAKQPTAAGGEFDVEASDLGEERVNLIVWKLTGASGASSSVASASLIRLAGWPNT